MGWLAPPKEPEGHRHNFQTYMARLKGSAPIGIDDLMQALLEKGISTRRGVMAIHRELPYRNAAWNEHLPETNSATDETIVLPLYHQMTEEEQDYVMESLYEIAAGAASQNRHAEILRTSE